MPRRRAPFRSARRLPPHRTTRDTLLLAPVLRRERAPAARRSPTNSQAPLGRSTPCLATIEEVQRHSFQCSCTAIAVELTRSGAVWPSAHGPRWRIHNYRRAPLRSVRVRAIHRTARQDGFDPRSARSKLPTTRWRRRRTGSTRPSVSSGPMPPRPWDDVDELRLHVAQLGVDGLVTSQQFGDCAGHHRPGRLVGACAHDRRRVVVRDLDDEERGVVAAPFGTTGVEQVADGDCDGRWVGPAPRMVSASSSTVTASSRRGVVTPSVYSTRTSPGKSCVWWCGCGAGQVRAGCRGARGVRPGRRGVAAVGWG